MKKTLFAMAALALCGTAVATDMYIPTSGPMDIYNEGVTVHVNKPANPDYISVSNDGAATFKFYGENIISSAGGILCSDGASFNITGDEAAINRWVSALTSPAGEVKSVTLMSFGETFYVFTGADHDFTFDGNVGGESVTLGTAALTYMGSFTAANETVAKTLITGDNQIALVAIGGDTEPGQLALVGKISGAATPEPATATLSLLALAGLCARRRRK